MIVGGGRVGELRRWEERARGGHQTPRPRLSRTGKRYAECTLLQTRADGQVLSTTPRVGQATCDCWLSDDAMTMSSRRSRTKVYWQGCLPSGALSTNWRGESDWSMPKGCLDLEGEPEEPQSRARGTCLLWARRMKQNVLPAGPRGRFQFDRVPFQSNNSGRLENSAKSPLVRRHECKSARLRLACHEPRASRLLHRKLQPDGGQSGDSDTKYHG